MGNSVATIGNTAANATASSATKAIDTMVGKRMKNCFNIERIIVGSCDFIETKSDIDKNIRVGVLGHDDPENPLSNQALKIGDSEPYRLKAFVENKDQLIYTFEKDVNLTVMKRRGSIVFHLKTPDLDVTKEVDPAITRMYKTIDMASDEIDKIGKFYKMQ